MICRHCGETIHQNQFDKIWRHWDSYRTCISKAGNHKAEPKLETPDNIELGGWHD
ncbi:hypothetical protein QCN36_gp87 [Arthrobacter phage CastorTray]|uniref:Uncharacterized protein n=1 Tax=Arthrobacter phage CastorTray TaxID=2859632 RepID=A0AAE7WDJ3_9CAUD|nr:hypothetical protein QCN36_gp87 [Arthrobacter phage CastorTray]QYC55078.1 hypothetical protein SEA_CASTORTRAY_87 [Arthrobacter phage CastorTray]